jgi:Right handed beta helix region
VKIPWPRNRRERAVWGTVALAGCLAVSAHRLERWRLPPPDRFASSVFRVTTGADDGPGSLRQAILWADRAVGRTRIVIAIPRIVLEAPLPPLVNPAGVVVDVSQPGAELDAARLSGAALDIASPDTFVSDLRIVGGGAGLVVRAPRATLRNLTLLEHDTGVLVGDGAGSLRITDSLLARNRVGIYMTAPVGMTTLQNARFEDHQVAAIWAVDAVPPSTGASQIDIVGNRFRNDAIGLVAINVIARVEGNKFDGQGTTAVHVSGGRATIINNQILAGHGFGIYAERLQSGYISRNEIARNCNGGMLSRDSGNTQVIANDVYRNGYGVVLMEGLALSPNTVANNLIADHIGDGILLIGSSPIVTGNRVLRNRLSGFRLSSLTLGSEATRVPAPLLAENVVQDNGLDELQRDRYVSDAPTTPAAAADCTWRLGATSIQAIQSPGVR